MAVTADDLYCALERAGGFSWAHFKNGFMLAWDMPERLAKHPVGRSPQACARAYIVVCMPDIERDYAMRMLGYYWPAFLNGHQEYSDNLGELERVCRDVTAYRLRRLREHLGPKNPTFSRYLSQRRENPKMTRRLQCR